MVKFKEDFCMSRRGENIYKRKDGRWEGRYIKEYIDSKAKYASVYAQSYLEVKNKLILAKSNFETENNVDCESFGFYAEKWLSEMKPQIKHSTYVKYNNIVNNHIIEALGNSKVSAITTDVMRNFILKKLKEGNIKTHSGLSAKTVTDIVSVIKLILTYAKAVGATNSCDFKQLAIKKNGVSENNMSKEVQDRLVKYLLTDIDYTKLGILLCLYTGIRIGELCAMRLDDILINEKTIRVTKTMQRLQTLSSTDTKTRIVVTDPKSLSSQREIPLPDFLINIIIDLNYRSNAYILTGTNERYIEPRTLEYRFKAILKKCGLENYKFHQLRHRFATQCVELGFDIKCLSEILGHSSVNITLNRYVHSTMELKKNNMAKLQHCIAY